MNKTILFDLDGVLSLPEEVFSILYTQSRGYDIEPFTNFFETEWNDFVTGRCDLKEHIQNHPDFWKWDKSPDELLQYWFESENMKNEALVELIQSIRSDGTKCYIATEQERYRTAYIKNVMFKDDFDGVFSTAEIGYRKNDSKFYAAIIDALAIQPSELMFFDDSQSKVDSAKMLGVDAHLYKSVEQVRRIVLTENS